MSQVMNFGKAEHRNKTQGVILHQQGLSKISGQTGVSRCPVQALLEKRKETSNAEDHVDNVQLVKFGEADETNMMHSFLENPKQ